MASSIVWMISERALSPPHFSTTSLNCWRSSPFSIAAMFAPMSSTSYCSRTPASSSAIAALRAVWPPRVGSSASGRSLAMIVVEDLGRDGLDVGRVGELGVGHDRGRVRVDEDDPQALLLQDAAGLRARVVELARLTDDDRPGADDQDAGDVSSARHGSDLTFGGRGDRCGVRRGAGGPCGVAHQVEEAVEEVGGVVRARGGLGVVLHREGRAGRGTRAPRRPGR